MKRIITFIFLISFVFSHASETGFCTESSRPDKEVKRKHVLILNSHQQGLPIPDQVISGILEILKKNSFSIDDIYIEHLDLFRFSTSRFRNELALLLAKKYNNVEIDLIITITKPAADFLENEGSTFKQSASVLAAIMPSGIKEIHTGKINRNKAVIPWKLDSAGTLRYALKLFPATKRVVVVAGVRDEFLPYLPGAKMDFKQWEGRLEFEYTEDLSYEEMCQRISVLPQDSIIIYAPYFFDKTGRSFIPVEVAVDIAEMANVPVFGVLDVFIVNGIIGGSVLNSKVIGEQAGRFALDILNGKISLSEETTLILPDYIPMFDWHQLKKNDLDISTLPSESVFKNRPLTLWSQYKAEVISTVIVIVFLLVLLTVLQNWNRRLKNAEMSIRESEKKFRSYIENSPDGIFVADDNGYYIDVNPAAEKITGYSRQELLSRSIRDLLAEETADLGITHFKTLKEIGISKGEMKFIHKSGEIKWWSVDAVKLSDKRYLGFVKDITVRKSAEDEIKKLLAEKELLLNEVHHRIKNNMNTIRGLLTLQIAAEKNTAAASSLMDAEARVQSMILLYDRLYSCDNYRELSVTEYIVPLAEKIVAGFPESEKIKISTDVEDFILNVNKLTPLGIIINELLTNMMKYAFAGRDDGVIGISVSKTGNNIVVVVQDNGVGIPENIDFGNSTGFGLNLVKMIIEQINGSVHIERGGGTKFIIEFSV